MPPSTTENSNDMSITPSKYGAIRPLNDKVALVTGGARGIGRGIALELADRGCNIVINYFSNASKAEEVATEIVKRGSKAIAVKADVTKPKEIFKLFETTIAYFGKLDIVISNAGEEAWFKEEEVTPDDFDYIFDLNCRGQFFVAQQGLKHLSRGGRIILTSSVAATMSGIPNHALYAGSKAAVEGFTRSFSVDGGEKGVTVNAIAPGGVKTDMYDENAWHYVPNGYPGMHMAAIDAALANCCPLKRVGLPSDIAKAVALLVSPDGEWINGQVIKLTGGSMT